MGPECDSGLAGWSRARPACRGPYPKALWGLPGGAMDLGESVGQAVVREVREETGLEVQPTGLVGIYSDPAT